MIEPEDNGCEHCLEQAPLGKRFCSAACVRCEHESEDEETGCDGICGKQFGGHLSFHLSEKACKSGS